MNESHKTEQSLANLQRALVRLGEVLEENIEVNGIVMDATIQRFEFSIELFWKTLKRMLYDEGITAGTPKEVMKHAFKLGWIEHESVWLAMWKDRNQTSHVYDENTAKEIYEHIRNSYHKELLECFVRLQERKNQG